MNASDLAQLNHILDFALVVLPVLVEHARGARHGDEERVGSDSVLADWVLLLCA